MKTKITVKDLDEWEACHRGDGERYSDANLKKLIKGKTSISIIEVLNLRIPPEDKLWVVLRPEIIPEKILYKLGYIFAKRVVKKYCLKCGIAKVEVWAREYLELDVDKLYKDRDAARDAARAARDAAWAAARDAVRDAAWAAWAAAWAAAWDAARDAAARDAAAWDAAWAARAAAAWDAAARAATDWDAERKWQVKKIKEIIKEMF